MSAIIVKLRRRPARWQTADGFTLLEMVVAVGLTAFLAGLLVMVLAGVSGFWARTVGQLSAEAKARTVLDQMMVDLHGTLFRNDGRTWFAVTIPTTATEMVAESEPFSSDISALKPSNQLGSLHRIATGAWGAAGPDGPRFGQAGTWLRFFTVTRGRSESGGSASDAVPAPVAVAYRIVRRAPSDVRGTPEPPVYLLHRAEVRANGDGNRPGTLQAGFDLTAPAYATGINAPMPGDPAEIVAPTLASVLAENVVDFGVRLYTYAPGVGTGSRQLIRIFPDTDEDLVHFAQRPAGEQNAPSRLAESFPAVVDVSLRILTDEGARLLSGYEAMPPRASPGGDQMRQDSWWDIVIAHSRVFTRRIHLPSVAF